MPKSEKIPLGSFNESTDVMDIDVETTDMFTGNTISLDIWEKEYVPFFIEKTGVLKFRLYESCNCTVELQLEIQKKGYGVYMSEKRCDLCRKEPPDVNKKRVRAVYTSVCKNLSEWTDDRENWKKFCKIIKKKTGRDLIEEGLVAIAPRDRYDKELLWDVGKLLMFIQTLVLAVGDNQNILSEEDKKRFEIICSEMPRILKQDFFQEAESVMEEKLKSKLGNRVDTEKFEEHLADRLGIDPDKLRNELHKTIEEIIKREKSEDNESE